MLTFFAITRRICTCLLAIGLLVGSGPMWAQRSVGFLRTASVELNVDETVTTGYSEEESFTLERNLIFFVATVDGQAGNYILDTGAPSLIVNHRGATVKEVTRTGIGAGGDVALTDHRISQFEMGGRTTDNYWAIGLDLRDLEERMDRQVDGFVGYDLINTGELRIDYGGETFQLLKSTRRPQHMGKAPRAVLKFTLVDHLPVVRLKIGGKKYFFAVDTGAGSNLLDRKFILSDGVTKTPEVVNIQGLDGRDADCPTVQINSPGELPAGAEPLRFVALDMDHLHSQGSVPLAGILGSEFLSRYTVGIDYRRQKLYLW